MAINYIPYKILDFEGSNYIYLSNSGAIYLLDNLSFSILSCKNRDEKQIIKEVSLLGFSEKEINDTIDTFKKIGLVNVSEIKGKSIASYSLTGVELLVSQRCNLACSYCYADEGNYHNAGDMSEDVGYKAIDLLFEHSMDNNLTVSFFGGEPILRFDLIRKYVLYAKELAKKNNKNIFFATTTNGTLVNKEIADFLMNNNFSVTISLDGNSVSHNQFRVTKSGNGTYDKTINGLNLFEGSNVILRATKANKSIQNFCDTCDSLYGIRKSKFFISEAIETYKTEDDAFKLKDEYHNLVESFYNDLCKGDYEKCKANLLVYLVIKRIAHPAYRRFYCDALIKGVAIDIKGDIFPCHRFVSCQDFKIGNVYTKGINYNKVDNTSSKFYVRNRIKCDECWALNICGGGCPYINYVSNDDCCNPNELKCKIYKSFYLDMIYLYLKLTPKQKEALSI